MGCPTHQSSNDLQRFLGLAFHYRRFVRDYGSNAAALHKLTEKNRQFRLPTEYQQAFDTLKSKRVSADILAFPDTSATAGTSVLDIDDGDRAIGGVLSEKGSEEQEHVIFCASNSILRAERNYSTTQRELLALVCYVYHVRQYLLRHRFGFLLIMRQYACSINSANLVYR